MDSRSFEARSGWTVCSPSIHLCDLTDPTISSVATLYFSLKGFSAFERIYWKNYFFIHLPNKIWVLHHLEREYVYLSFLADNYKKKKKKFLGWQEKERYNEVKMSKNSKKLEAKFARAGAPYAGC